MAGDELYVAARAVVQVGQTPIRISAMTSTPGRVHGGPALSHRSPLPKLSGRICTERDFND